VYAWRDRGVRRATGILVIAAYAVFVGSVLVTAHATGGSRAAIAAGATVAIVSAVRLVFSREGSGDPDTVTPLALPLAGEFTGNDQGPAIGYPQASDRARPPRTSLLPGWPARRLWFLGLGMSAGVAALDAALGHRIILIGLLIAGPCCVLLTGRWILTGVAGLWATGLAVVLGFPDGIWGTGTHLVFLAVVAAVALISTFAAAFVDMRTPPA
jgi:hypothetical protein